MPPADLRLVWYVLDRTDRMTTEATDRLHDLLAFGCTATSTSCHRQLTRFGFRPKVFGDCIDFCDIALIPMRGVVRRRSAAVVIVPPELRHACLGFEFLRIREPLTDPLFREFPGYGREIRPHLADAVVTRNLVAAEAAVDADEVASAVEHVCFGNFRTGVVALVAACLDVVHREHRSL